MAKAPINLRIIANSAFSHTWQSVLVPEFNKVYPNIRVTIDGVPYAEHLAKLMLEATSTNPEYDVLIIDDPWTPQLAQLGALVDLKGPKSRLSLLRNTTGPISMRRRWLPANGRACSMPSRFARTCS